MNRLDTLFEQKKKNILAVYCTAGFPKLESTGEILLALQDAGADIIELGMPYSDPVADGPVIQHSNSIALANGMSILLLLKQLKEMKDHLKVPMVLMGYLNPVMQYGVEKFCADAAAAGVSGVILPDLPAYEYERFYQPYFKKNRLQLIFLITPQTPDAGIKKADKLSNGFIYAVSSSSTTGTTGNIGDMEEYFKKLSSRKFKNPVLIGFGIKGKRDFNYVCRYATGGIIGSAYVRAVEKAGDIKEVTKKFIDAIREMP